MAKLEIDVPLFKRCCFCFPLRCGLFVFGGLKLYSLHLMLFITTMDDFTNSPSSWICALVIAFNILLIAAVILQKEKLYNIYYKCAILELVVILLFFVVVQIKTWQYWSETKAPSDLDSHERAGHEFLLYLIVDSLIVFVFLVQGYVTLLVRSALIILREAAPSVDNTVEVESQSTVGKCVEV